MRWRLVLCEAAPRTRKLPDAAGNAGPRRRSSRNGLPRGRRSRRLYSNAPPAHPKSDATA
jgi:hypothetical protein